MSYFLLLLTNFPHIEFWQYATLRTQKERKPIKPNRFTLLYLMKQITFCRSAGHDDDVLRISCHDFLSICHLYPF